RRRLHLRRVRGQGQLRLLVELRRRQRFLGGEPARALLERRRLQRDAAGGLRGRGGGERSGERAGGGRRTADVRDRPRRGVRARDGQLPGQRGGGQRPARLPLALRRRRVVGGPRAPARLLLARQ